MNATYPDSLKVDPDILGIGVLVAFGGTAMATIVLILIGYLTDSLPESCLTVADHAVLKLRTEPETPEKHFKKERRVKVLTRFILVLSDLQLVTGLAVLIGALANPWCVSGYELLVVTSLAWFSAMTHLATLDVLQEYFRQKTFLRDCRILAMVLNLFLLIAAILAIIWYDRTFAVEPLACTDHGNWRSRSLYDGDLLYILEGVVPSFVQVVFLLLAFADRILNLYGTSPTFGGHTTRLVRVYCYLHMRHRFPGRDRTSAGRMVELEQALSRNEEHDQQEYIERRGRVSTSTVLNNYLQSFLSNIATLFFVLSYGLSLVIVSRTSYAPKLEAGANRMDFGQIVPLILLALPPLAAAEVFLDSQPKNSNTSVSATPTPDALQLVSWGPPSKSSHSGQQSRPMVSGVKLQSVRTDDHIAEELAAQTSHRGTGAASTFPIWYSRSTGYRRSKVFRRCSLTLYMMFVTKFLFAVYIGIALNWLGDQFAVPLIAECYMASYMFYFSLYVLTRVLRLPGRINAVVGEHQS